MVKQAKLTYDPAARFEVDSTEVVYRDDGQTQWPMTVFRPRAAGPFPALVRVHGGAWNVGVEGPARLLMLLAESGPCFRRFLGCPNVRFAPDSGHWDGRVLRGR